MLRKFVILGSLPGLNEYIAVERSHRQAAAKLKRDTETLIRSFISVSLRNVKFFNPVIIDYLWIEQNRRRDKDNIAFAKKFVQDALVSAKVLAGDGWKHIRGFSDAFDVDKINPRIEVTIREVKERK